MEWYKVEMKFNNDKINELIQNGTLTLEAQTLSPGQKEEYHMDTFGKMHTLTAAPDSNPLKARTILRKRKD